MPAIARTSVEGAPLTRRAPHRAWVALLSIWLLSCGLDLQVQRLQDDLVRLREQHKEDFDKLRHRHEIDIRRIWAKVNCTNQQVRDFVHRCEAENGPGCSEQAVASAL